MRAENGELFDPEYASELGAGRSPELGQLSVLDDDVVDGLEALDDDPDDGLGVLD